MKIYILNESLERIKPVSIYDSITWNTFYAKEGNFTLEIPLYWFEFVVPSEEEDRFIEYTRDPDNIGVIETVEKKTDDSGQKSLIVKGRMSTALLDRRISYGDNNFENKYPRSIIKNLLEDNFLSPSDTLRKIDLIEYTESKQPVLKKIDYDLKRGDEILYTIKQLCQITDFGFNMGLNSDATKLQFMLYQGNDRTASQNDLVPFIIQQKRGIVTVMEYYKDDTKYKNYAEVDKENKVRTYCPKTNQKSGLRRRETFFDMSSVSQTIRKADGTEVKIADIYYENMIINDTIAKLMQLQPTEYVDSEINKQLVKKFRNDVYLGDWITVKDDESGFSMDTYISGATEVESKEGYQIQLQLGSNSIQ